MFMLILFPKKNFLYFSFLSPQSLTKASTTAGIYSLGELMMDEYYIMESSKEMLMLIKESSKDSLGLVNEVLQMQFKTEALDKTTVKLVELLQRCVS